MEIVVLDGYALNPGDISWHELEQIGDVTIYDRTTLIDEELILQRIGDAKIIFTNKTPITKNILSKCPNLKYIGVLATGYNVVDFVTAKKLGITVTNIPEYGTNAVAQHTFALILEITNQVGLHNQSVHQGEWETSLDFSYTKTALSELAGKTIGLIGYGAIAKRVAKIAHAFQMRVIYYNHRPKEPEEFWAQQVSLTKLYAESDILSLHIPQTTQTQGMINYIAISQMKLGVILINTSRGGLLDECAVANSLNNGKIAALGTDVLACEPPKSENPLISAKNCFLTPHIAWAPTETRSRLLKIAITNLKAYLAGEMLNRIN